MTIGVKTRLFTEKTHVRRRNIFEGTTKNILEGNDPGTFVLYFKDDHPMNRFGEEPLPVLSGKGVINNRLSELLFQRLGELNIDHHLIDRLNMREQLVRIGEAMPFYVEVHNKAADDFVTRFSYAKYHALPDMITELRFKNKIAGDPVVAPQHLVAFGATDHNELEQLFLTTQRINDFLMGQFSALHMNLVRYRLEFGRVYMSENPIDTRLMLIDEISLDTCRIIDTRSDRRMDVLNDLISEREQLDQMYRTFTFNEKKPEERYQDVEGYHEIARRFGLINDDAAESVVRDCSRKSEN